MAAFHADRPPEAVVRSPLKPNGARRVRELRRLRVGVEAVGVIGRRAIGNFGAERPAVTIGIGGSAGAADIVINGLCAPRIMPLVRLPRQLKLGL